jgi:hypothetical protein
MAKVQTRPEPSSAQCQRRSPLHFSSQHFCTRPSAYQSCDTITVNIVLYTVHGSAFPNLKTRSNQKNDVLRGRSAGSLLVFQISDGTRSRNDDRLGMAMPNLGA